MNSLINKAKKLFVDSIRLRVQGGKGGHGLPQFGGIGGKGGDVYIKGSIKTTSLKSLSKHKADLFFKAQDGYPSRRTRLLGESGQDLVIKVPLGVTVMDSQKQILGDINKPDEKIVVALGGRGGDKYNDNQGFIGQIKSIRLDLKMISDAVLVGFPNAGKSSLLRALSNATPKVADYPFTTLKPNLGTIKFSDFRQITIADLPGLVEGAHKNLGLGHEFLKHIERTKLLIFLIDINNVDLGPSYSKRSPLETLCILNKEIELYNDTILSKPAILAISKMDTLKDSRERFIKLEEELESFYKNKQIFEKSIDDSIRPTKLIKFDEVIPISSVQHKNIKELKQVIRNVIDTYAEAERHEHNNITSYRELQPLENNRLIQ